MINSSMKNFFLILLIILLAGSGYFLYNLNNTNVQLQTQISWLEWELSWLTLQIVELQSIQTTTWTTEEVLPELPNTKTWNMSLEEENLALKELAQKYRDALILEKLKNKSTTDTTTTTNTTTATTTNTITPIVSTNKIVFSNQWIDAINNICKWYNSEWIPNSNRAKAAKFINSKLQDVRDNWQQLVNKYVNEANTKLDEPWLSNSDKCMYSWLIDELQNQKWYLKSYKTENGVTTIGIDFLTYQDDISKIKYDWSPRLDVMKNTSTKVRYYILSSNPQLQSLYTDNNWYATYYDSKEYQKNFKYLNNFNNRLNEFCGNQKIYTNAEWANINRNENNMYCVKNRLKNETHTFIFNFNVSGELQKIDLNWRHLTLAG